MSKDYATAYATIEVSKRTEGNKVIISIAIDRCEREKNGHRCLAIYMLIPYFCNKFSCYAYQLAAENTCHSVNSFLCFLFGT